MDLKINAVDRRSPYSGLASTSLYALSIGTASIGGLLVLPASSAYGYAAITTTEGYLQVTTSNLTTNTLNTQAVDPTQNSELPGQMTGGSSADSVSYWSVEDEQNPELETDEAPYSDEPYASIDSTELNSEKIELASSSINLVEEFDAIVGQLQEPFIEIPDGEKSVWVNPVALELQPESELELEPELEISQSSESIEEPVLSAPSQQATDLGEPLVTAQGVYLLEGNDSSARARLSASYALNPNVLFGATLDLTTGDAFTDSPEAGLDLNELYVTVSPPSVPSLRLTLGMIDLTSYFDRNSFAKDAATHFFNPVFQTNPALAAAGIGSRPGALVNWDLTDNLSLRGAAFSSDRDLDDFAFDAAAAEIALRLGNFIVRGTYVTDRDAGQESGFNEIFQFRRDDDEFGLQSDDREVAYGVNAEYFIPEINLGLDMVDTKTRHSIAEAIPTVLD